MNSFDSAMVLKVADMMFMVLNKDGFCTGIFRPKDQLEFTNNTSILNEHFTAILPKMITLYIQEAILELKEKDTMRMFEFALNNDLWISMQVLLLDNDRNYLISIRNSTEEKVTLELLQNNERRLQDTAFSVKHDMKNYIFKVNAFLELLKIEHNVTHIETIEALIDEMHTLLDYMTSIIIDSKKPDKMTYIDLSKLIGQIARANVPKDIVFVQEKLPLVIGHRISVFQIFRNLIENAVFHGKPTKIEFSTERVGLLYKVRVTNNGDPIPENLRQHIFSDEDSYHDGHATKGLRIIKRLVDQHGWKIELLDTENTTFQISIPI